MSKENPQPKPVADWERIELDYRAGIKTLRQIAEEHGITHALQDAREVGHLRRELAALGVVGVALQRGAHLFHLETLA